MAREKVCFKSISVGDGFLLRERGIIYIKTNLSFGRQIIRGNSSRPFSPRHKVIWLGKVVDVVTEF